MLGEKRNQAETAGTASQTRTRAVVGVSTFTHVGRHIEGLRSTLTCSYPYLDRVALLGSGPIEPFVVCALLARLCSSGGEVWAIDVNPEINRCLMKLVRGEWVEVVKLASICRDDADIRLGMLNENFTSRWSEAVADCLKGGIQSPFIMSNDGRRLAANVPSGTRIHVEEMSAEEFLSAAPDSYFDVLYMGLLLTNMRKRGGSAVVIHRLLNDLRRSISADGTLGLGCSLSPTYGVERDIASLAKHGWTVRCVSLEYVLFSRGQYFGDYGVIALPRPRRGCTARLRWREAEEWCSLIESTVLGLHGLVAALGDATNANRFVVAALEVSRGKWHLYSIEESELSGLVSEGHRLWFDLVYIEE